MPPDARPAGTPKHICVVGSLNADLVVKMGRVPRPGETVVGTSFERFPGGKGANQAYAAARLAAGAGSGSGASVAVSMIGRVGADEYGGWLRDNLARAGVDVDGVTTDDETGSGVAVIAVDGAGQNQIIVVPGANDTLTPAALDARALARADLLLLQLEIPLATVEAAARAASERGCLVILDPAPARALPDADADAIWGLCDYLTPNEGELCALVGRPAPTAAITIDEAASAGRLLLSRGARNVIVKLGAAGALLVTSEGILHWPAFPVRAIDTTAAGDTFNAALAIGLAQGQAIAEAGRFACAAAALAVTRAGAQPSVPDRAEVLALLRAPAA